MSSPAHDPLDAALASLTRDAQPSRDLWPTIRATIDVESVDVKSRPSRETISGEANKISAHGSRRKLRWLSGWGQLAAGIALMIVTSVTTYVVTRQAAQHDLLAHSFISTDFDASTLGADYIRARADLDRLFAQRLASLPPATREKLQDSLADLRRAADEIAATLAERPSDSLLQELLVSTRRRELQLLADISQMAIPNSPNS